MSTSRADEDRDTEPRLFARNWRYGAACRGASARAWTLRDGRAFARDHCSRCPVIDRCAEEADRLHAEGTWAGSHRALVTRGSLDRYTVVTNLIPNAPRHTCTRKDCPRHARDSA